RHARRKAAAPAVEPNSTRGAASPRLEPDVPGQDEDDDDQGDEPEPARRIVTPVAAVRPRREGADHGQDEEHHEERADHESPPSLREEKPGLPPLERANEAPPRASFSPSGARPIRGEVTPRPLRRARPS